MSKANLKLVELAESNPVVRKVCEYAATRKRNPRKGRIHQDDLVALMERAGWRVLPEEIRPAMEALESVGEAKIQGKFYSFTRQMEKMGKEVTRRPPVDFSSEETHSEENTPRNINTPLITIKLTFATGREVELSRDEFAQMREVVSQVA